MCLKNESENKMNQNRTITDETRRIRDHKNRDKLAEAEDRRKLADTRNAEKQIAILNARLGVGAGAVKERARLRRKMGE